MSTEGLTGRPSDVINPPVSQFSAAAVAARLMSTSAAATAHSPTSSSSSSMSKTGRIFSPRFPQNYRPQSACYYQFHAWSNERIQIQFTSIDLEPNDQRSGLQLTQINTAAHCSTCLTNPSKLISTVLKLMASYTQLNRP
jgi:hypothetical protein